MRILSGHRGPVRCMAYSPDGRYLASSAEDNTIRVWQLETGYEALRLRTPGGYARGVSFEDGGKTLIAVISTPGQQQAWSLTFHAEGLLSCQPQPETRGTLQALGRFARSIFEAARRKKALSFRRLPGSDEPQAFSGDARLLAVTGPPSTVRLIDNLSGRELAAYDWNIGPIYTVAFAPDGMTAAAGGRDFRIVVWDLEF